MNLCKVSNLAILSSTNSFLLLPSHSSILNCNRQIEPRNWSRQRHEIRYASNGQDISFRRAVVERWLRTLIYWGFGVLRVFLPLLWVPARALPRLCSVLDSRSFRETCSCSVEMMLQYRLEMSLINNKYQHCWLLRLRYAQMWYLSDGYVVKNQMVAVVNNFKEMWINGLGFYLQPATYM